MTNQLTFDPPSDAHESASGFPERDWKHLRVVHRAALDRYCSKVLEEIRATIADGTGSAHERYLRVSKLLLDRDRALAAAFDDMRRSRAFERLDAMMDLGVVTDEELSGFTPRIRDAALSRPRPRSRRRS
jgi:hypothetical protein